MAFFRRLAALTAVAAALATTAAITGGPREAQASWDWCYDDPLILVNGRILDIEVGVPLPHVKDITGPVDVRVYVPSNVSASVILNTSLLFKEEVTIVKTSEVAAKGKPINVRVEVTVPASKSFDTSLLVTSQDEKTLLKIQRVFGKSNQAMRYDVKLGALLGGLLP